MIVGLDIRRDHKQSIRDRYSYQTTKPLKMQALPWEFPGWVYISAVPPPPLHGPCDTPWTVEWLHPNVQHNKIHSLNSFIAACNSLPYLCLLCVCARACVCVCVCVCVCSHACLTHCTSYSVHMWKCMHASFPQTPVWTCMFLHGGFHAHYKLSFIYSKSYIFLTQ